MRGLFTGGRGRRERVVVTATAGAQVIVVAGELDLSAAPQFKPALAGSAGTGYLLIDLSDCPFIEASEISGSSSTRTPARWAGRSRHLRAPESTSGGRFG